MAKYNKRNQQTQDKTKEEADQIANATQRPGQTKEQTKIIAKGIQKGIEQYKKQHKAKARELNKKIKSVNKKEPNTADFPSPEVIIKYNKLPWFLLTCSWALFVLYVLF